MRSMWILEVLFLLSVVDLDTTSASEFPCPKRRLTVTVDDYLKLYFDGAEVTGLSKANIYNKPDVVDLPCTTKLIAIHGRNGRDMKLNVAGILASTDDDYVLTNSSWICSNVGQYGWADIGFDDSAWRSAVEYGNNGNSVLVHISSISSKAQWIWLRQDVSKYVAMDYDVYCRRRLVINKCESFPCLHGGSCFNSVNDYVCVCPPEWTGVRCGIHIDACDSNPCLNGGTCKTPGGNSFACTCPTYATGVKCESPINYCDSIPCLHGGSCKSTVNGYDCQCQSGYIGDNCEYAINTCGSRPCLNGGSCLNSLNGYICQCQLGYTGNRCQDDINACDPNPCMNGGTCKTPGDNSFTCTCPTDAIGVKCESPVSANNDSTSSQISGVFIGVSVVSSIALLYSLCVFCSRNKNPKNEVKVEDQSEGNKQNYQYDQVNNENVRRRNVEN